MSSVCEKCTKTIIDEAEAIECKGLCGRKFHCICAGLNVSSLKRLTRGEKSKWVCVKCKDDLQDKQNSNAVTSLDDNNKQSYSEILQMMTAIREENASFKTDILQKLCDFEKALQFHSSQLEDTINSNLQLREEIKVIHSQNEKLIQENSALKSQITEIKNEMIDLQQYSRRLNIQLDNLPEVENENIQETISSVMKNLDLDLTANIVTAHRVPTIKKDKIKPLIIQFNAVNAKETFLKAAKTKRPTADLVNSRLEKLPLYFNDHLCSELKKLLYECKKFKKENNFMFCWTKSGKIFLRKDEGSRVLRIKNITDLPNVSK